MVTVALAGVAGLAMGVVGTRAVAGEIGDKAAIEQIVHDYILAHPEILPEAMLKLQEKRAASAISDNRAEIEKPFAGAWAGNPQPKVTLVMFSDYSCVYCRASAPDVAKLLAQNPDLKVVWREIPILGPASVTAARIALATAKTDEGKYLRLHQGIFAAGRPDDATLAKLTAANGLDAGKMATIGKGEDVTAEIANNLKLARALGVDGTPAFVIGDQMLSGAVGYDALKKAIDAARRG